MTDINVLKGATIAFDLDGTLVESAPDLIAAVNSILIAEDLKPLTLKEARPFVSRGARWLLQWGIASGGVPEPAARAAALFDRFINYYSAHIADESHPFPGVIKCSRKIDLKFGAVAG
ncbi:HAD hydrolase-like protein [Ralstonia pseudosolanacearum]